MSDSGSWNVLSRELRDREANFIALLQKATVSATSFQDVESSLILQLSQMESLVGEMWESKKGIEQLTKARRAKQNLKRNKDEVVSLQERFRTLRARDQLFANGELSPSANESLLEAERGAIARSLHSATETTDQASMIFHSLRNDRNKLSRSRSGMVSIAQNLPGVGEVIGRIKNKKTRDNTILAIVVAVCIIVLILIRFA